MKTVRMLYLIFANTLVLLFAVLFAIHCLLLFYYRDRSTGEVYYRNLPEVVKKNFAHMTTVDAELLFEEANTLTFKYASWIGWREALLSTRFLNIDRHGIRSNGKGGESLARIQDAIWFFGGSTTWGEAVTDQETIPAQLEKIVRRPVINFGVNAFYSEQENLLMVQYLRRGYRPAAVLFLDGINERCGDLPFQNEMNEIFVKAQTDFPYKWDPLVVAKPAVIAIRKLRERYARTQAPARSALTCEGFEDVRPLRAAHAQILAERAALCRLYALRCITLVQPFAGMHGRHEDPSTLNEQDRRELREKFEHLEANWKAANAVFVTDALDKLEQHAYVDDTHYSAVASTLIAQAIAKHLGAPP